MSGLISQSELFDQTPERPPLKVLVVDDEEGLRTMFRLVLEKNGYIVVLAEDRDEAKQCLQADIYDTVLTDLMLAGQSGLDVLWDSARIQPDTSRILISARVDLESVMVAVNGVGVYQVMEKPFVNEELLQALDRSCSLTRVIRERNRLQKQLEERTKELEKLNTALETQVVNRTGQLLGGLLSALDYRDTESQAHSRRVAAYARRLGQELGLSGQELADCTAGALLHDVGKIGVPDQILRKPGPLNDDEWQIMQRHPLLGDELLTPIAFLQGARRVVCQHHERWDGTGYPKQLSGEAIDLGARIFAVVDAHDAITSDRPHRRGRHITAARELIALAVGTQFDPKVVEAYQAVDNATLEELGKQYQDGSPWTGFAELLAGLKDS